MRLTESKPYSPVDPFKRVDVALKFDVIRAAIVFFATITFVDNAVDFIELFGACIEQFLLQAF